MRTISDLARTLHSKLGPYFEQMLPDLMKNMHETQSFDMILDTLVILRRLFRGASVDH